MTFILTQEDDINSNSYPKEFIRQGLITLEAMIRLAVIGIFYALLPICGSPTESLGFVVKNNVFWTFSSLIGVSFLLHKFFGFFQVQM